VNFVRGEHPTAVTVRTNRCRKGHELIQENTITKSDGRRECRTCDNAAQRRRYAQRRAVA
jgi:formylmethanofuran dehydrogenase subunit E